MVYSMRCGLHYQVLCAYQYCVLCVHKTVILNEIITFITGLTESYSKVVLFRKKK